MARPRSTRLMLAAVLSATGVALRVRVAVALGILLVAGPASGHHNMRAAFDLNTRSTGTGTLTRLEWTNPHIHLFVEVQNDQGRVELWSFEGPSPGRLRDRRAAFTASVSKDVAVEASPARDGTFVGLIREIRLADGQLVSLCPQNC